MNSNSGSFLINACLFVICLCINLKDLCAQTGSVQVFTRNNAEIYLKGDFAGKYGGLSSGYIFNNVPVGEVTIKCVKKGYHDMETKVVVHENQTVTVELKTQKGHVLRRKRSGCSGTGRCLWCI